MELVLLDRDGVLNEDRADSVKSPEELVLLPGAASAVARLNATGIKVAVVTNQSVIGRGLVDTRGLDAIHEALERALARKQACLDAIFVAPDHPDRPTERRKPGGAMLTEALTAFSAEAERTPMIGDALRDLQAATAVGCRRILVRSGKGVATLAAGLPDAVKPVAVYDDLAAAVDALLAGR